MGKLSEEVRALVKCVRCSSCYEDGAKAEGCPVPHANEDCDTLPDRIKKLEDVAKAAEKVEQVAGIRPFFGKALNDLYVALAALKEGK